MSKQVQPRDIATVAAFFKEGLMRDNADEYREVLEAWGQGNIELVQYLTQYAEFTAGLMNIEGVNYSGVFEYDVCAPFGAWFAKRIVAGQTPTRDQCRIWLLHNVWVFFTTVSQGMDEDTLACLLMDVPFNVGEQT
jgi:hypothetical protein